MVYFIIALFYLTAAFIFAGVYFSKILSTISDNSEEENQILSESPIAATITIMVYGFFWIISLPFFIFKR